MEGQERRKMMMKVAIMEHLLEKKLKNKDLTDKERLNLENQLQKVSLLEEQVM